MKLLTQAQDVTDHILVLATNVVDDWFPNHRQVPTDDFIDRLCMDYGVGEGWDIDDLNTPAVRKIMRHVRAVKREMA